MRTFLSTLLVGFLAISVSAQITQVAVIPSPGSQINTLESCLIMSASAQSPDQISSPLTFVMGLFSPSSTFAYVTPGATTFSGAGSLNLSGVMEGAPNAPFILAVSVQTPGIPCGGPTAIPCMATPSLFSSIPTPFGQYHLDGNPFFLIDSIGLGLGGVNVPIGPTGQLPLVGAIPIDTIPNGGAERRIAMQALAADPTAAMGFTFSSCFNVDQWVDNP